MKAIRGRLLSDEIDTDMGKYLINQAAARLLGFDNPVGEYITMWGVRGEIAGVVEDFHHVSLHREIMPHVFNVNPGNYEALKFVFVKLTDSPGPATLSFIESVHDELAADWPFTYLSLEDEIAELYRDDLTLVKIIGLFVFLTILLSILSIYGLAYHSVEKKTREITIRKVFGAGLRDNLFLTYKKLLIQIGISFIIAIPLSVMVMGKWLTNFAYSVKLKPSYFVISLLIALLVAVITTTLAMWKTINRNPAENLKHS
jgi:ABC-type antimicrobial peptide transport system permease subunit